MTTTPITDDDTLRIELTFSREVTELPEFPKLAARAFARELGRHVDVVPADEATLLAEEKIRTAWLKQLLAEREVEIERLEREVNFAFRQLAGL